MYFTIALLNFNVLRNQRILSEKKNEALLCSGGMQCWRLLRSQLCSSGFSMLRSVAINCQLLWNANEFLGISPAFMQLCSNHKKKNRRQILNKKITNLRRYWHLHQQSFLSRCFLESGCNEVNIWYKIFETYMLGIWTISSLKTHNFN